MLRILNDLLHRLFAHLEAGRLQYFLQNYRRGLYEKEFREHLLSLEYWPAPNQFRIGRHTRYSTIGTPDDRREFVGPYYTFLGLGLFWGRRDLRSSRSSCSRRPREISHVLHGRTSAR
jgi:hypothetical protein